MWTFKLSNNRNSDYISWTNSDLKHHKFLLCRQNQLPPLKSDQCWKIALTVRSECTPVEQSVWMAGNSNGPVSTVRPGVLRSSSAIVFASILSILLILKLPLYQQQSKLQIACSHLHLIYLQEQRWKQVLKLNYTTTYSSTHNFRILKPKVCYMYP